VLGEGGHRRLGGGGGSRKKPERRKINLKREAKENGGGMGAALETGVGRGGQGKQA